MAVRSAAPAYHQQQHPQPCWRNNIRVLARAGHHRHQHRVRAVQFDTRWVNNITWTTSDQPVANALQTIQSAITPGGVSVIAQDQFNGTTGLIKPMPTGGVAGITFNTTYLLSNLRQAVNPAYQPTLTFSFEQPLLQGFGVEINQLRAAHPNSILNPFPSLSRTEGILITRVRFDEQRADFERQVNIMLANVRLYWTVRHVLGTLQPRGGPAASLRGLEDQQGAFRGRPHPNPGPGAVAAAVRKLPRPASARHERPA